MFNPITMMEALGLAKLVKDKIMDQQHSKSTFVPFKNMFPQRPPIPPAPRTTPIKHLSKAKMHQRKFQLKMGLLTFIQIPCHHVLANEIALNLKYHIGLKHFFNINLGIGIIKKFTFFVCIFNIYPCVFPQISIGRACWMWNKILHPTSTHSTYF